MLSKKMKMKIRGESCS